jgi:hypothetical protein
VDRILPFLTPTPSHLVHVVIEWPLRCQTWTDSTISICHWVAAFIVGCRNIWQFEGRRNVRNLGGDKLIWWAKINSPPDWNRISKSAKKGWGPFPMSLNFPAALRLAIFRFSASEQWLQHVPHFGLFFWLWPIIILIDNQ